MEIRRLRENRGLNMTQLASAMDVTVVAVRKWELGETMPSADKLPALADLLGCTIDELYGRCPPQAAS